MPEALGVGAGSLSTVTRVIGARGLPAESAASNTTLSASWLWTSLTARTASRSAFFSDAAPAASEMSTVLVRPIGSTESLAAARRSKSVVMLVIDALALSNLAVFTSPVFASLFTVSVGPRPARTP